MIEALYISDTTNTLIYEYSTTLTTPKFKTLLPKINQKSQNFKIELNQSYFLSVHNYPKFNLNFYLLCSTIYNSNPLIPSVFINRLIEVLQDYFGEMLSPNKIELNNDIITLLMYQMLDDDIPNQTDFNKLKDLVSNKSLLNKILSGAAQKVSSPLDTKQPVVKDTEDIPWRRANVKHTNNEMYVDVSESINVILKPVVIKSSSAQHFDSAFYSSKKENVKNHIINGFINGEITFLSRLSGTPTLQMILNSIGSKLDIPSFHKCIDLKTWNHQKGNLTFIPPDGKATLMKYQIDLNVENKHLLKNTLDVEFTFNKDDNEFVIKLVNLSQLGKIDYITIEINTQDDSDSIKLNRLTHGDYLNKSEQGKGEWVLKNIKNSIIPSFHGSVVNKLDEENPSLDKKPNIPPSYIKINYTHKGSVPSQLKIDSLKIINSKGLNNVKPYKGVKYITNSGNYIIRS